jgi:hypothetical protein
MATAAAVMLVRRIPDVTLHAKPASTVIDSGH